MTTPTPREIIAAGIRGYIACELMAYSYHEPARDTSLLSKVSDDADNIAGYILTGLRDNGYPGWITTNAAKVKPRNYTDDDFKVWSDGSDPT